MGGTTKKKDRNSNTRKQRERGRKKKERELKKEKTALSVSAYERHTKAATRMTAFIPLSWMEHSNTHTHTHTHTSAELNQLVIRAESHYF